MTQIQSVVIATLNSQYIHSSLAPWCLLAGIRAYGRDGISVCVLEGTINESREAVANRILIKNPDVVCFSCYIWNITQTLELVQRIKTALPGALVVLGGPEVSYNAKQVLRDNPAVGYVICGEGERALALLLNALDDQSDISKIPGLVYRRNTEICYCEPQDFDKEPLSPYLPEYFAALSGRIAYLETSRGCPFSCAFCLSGRCGGVRYFELSRVKREILLLANSGTKTVKFVDRTFNANSKRAKEIFSFIIDHVGVDIPQNVRFHFEIAGDLLDEKTLEILAQAPAGVMQVEIGLQSFNAKTLGSVRRKTDLDALQKNIRRLAASENIHIHIDLIAGLPYEEWDSFAKSFDTAYSLAPHMLQLGFLKLLHGSAMREQPHEYPCEHSQKPPYEVVQTPWMSVSELHSLHHVEDALNRLNNSGRFKRSLRYLLKSTGLPPFKLFRRFGEFAFEKSVQCRSLDGYTELFSQYFSNCQGVDPAVLRDCLVCDRMATNASGFLPKALRIDDPELRCAKTALNNNAATKKPDGVKRAVAILYTKQRVVYVDYLDKDPVTGEYELKEFPLEGIGTRRIKS